MAVTIKRCERLCSTTRKSSTNKTRALLLPKGQTLAGHAISFRMCVDVRARLATESNSVASSTWLRARCYLAVAEAATTREKKTQTNNNKQQQRLTEQRAARTCVVKHAAMKKAIQKAEKKSFCFLFFRMTVMETEETVLKESICHEAQHKTTTDCYQQQGKERKKKMKYEIKDCKDGEQNVFLKQIDEKKKNHH